MILARGSGPKHREVLFIGLSRRNVEKLLLNKPIVIRREIHGEGVPEGWEIVVLFGETELAIKEVFEKHGFIDERTKVHIDPKLNEERNRRWQ